MVERKKYKEYKKLFLQGYTESEIAKMLGVTKQSVNSYLVKNNYIDKKVIRDHEGKVYKTYVEMCEAWGVNRQTFYSRKKQGKSIKECLGQ